MDIKKALEKQIEDLQKEIENSNTQECIQLHAQLTACIELYAKIDGYLR